MKLKNIFTVGLIMFVASLFLFINLGSTSFPSRYFEAHEGAVISVNLERAVSFEDETDDILIFFSPSKDGDAVVLSVTFFPTEGGTHKLDYTLTQKDNFSWCGLPQEKMKPLIADEIKITVEQGNPRLTEIVIVEDGQVVNITRASVGVTNSSEQNLAVLFDEQSTYNSDHALNPHEIALATDVFNSQSGGVSQFGISLLSIGTKLFGFSSSGFRFIPALSRLLSILVVYLIGKKLLKSDTFAAIFAALTAFEGVSHLTAKTLCLEPVMGLFVLLAFYFLLNYLDKTQDKALKPLIWLALSSAALVLAVFVSSVALFYLLPLVAIWLMDALKSLKAGKKNTKMLALSGVLLILPVIVSLIWVLPLSVATTVFSLNFGLTAIYFLGLFIAVFLTLLTLTSKAEQKSTVIYLLAFLLASFLPMIFIPSFSFAAHYYLASIFILGFNTLAAKNWIEASHGQITLGKFAFKKSVAIGVLALVLFAVYFALSVSGLLGTLWLI